MVEIVFSEKELEDFLCKKSNLTQYLDLRYIARQVKTGVGVIDIFAYEKSTKSFVVVELKKDDLSFAGYEQVLRYKRFFATKYPDKNFKCLLVGKNLSEELFNIVAHYSPDNDILSNNYVNYSLFGMSFDEPITFSWFNKHQREIERNCYEYNTRDKA